MIVCSASQPIKKGDEILVSYGKAWWLARKADPTLEKEEDLLQVDV